MCLIISDNMMASCLIEIEKIYESFNYVIMTSPHMQKILALSRENVSSGFVTRVDSNQPRQLQRLARGLKLWM